MMRKKSLVLPVTALVTALLAGSSYQLSMASDHDDGEADIKARALNLTDHFAFRSPSNPDELSLVMYFNPRSLPGRQYSMSPNARYEFHVAKVASRTAAPTAAEDWVFRFEAGAPNAAGSQPITLTVFRGGTEIGKHNGSSTTFAGSKNNSNLITNTGDAGIVVKYFVGQRADSFHFDVVRFFQVRAFLATRFYGGAGGNGDATAGLSDNCRGDKFLARILPGGVAQNEAGGTSDGDTINLFNPPSCAPDFTKDLNVTAIVLNVPISALGSKIFDTWSTISVKE
jgi:Domain of unknown function (DUF4331)